VLQGKNFRARDAAEIRMIDAVVPKDTDLDAFAEKYLRETLPKLDRTPPPDLANAEALRELILPVIRKATGGRANPRAPYVALDVMIKGAGLPLKEAMRVERDAFIELATGPEAKAGMRFFFTQQQTQKLPKSCSGKPREITTVGVDGIDGYMGNAIAYLALEAGYRVIGHVPLAKFADAAPKKLAAKYERAVKKESSTADDVAKR
jgi:hypothetical protein